MAKDIKELHYGGDSGFPPRRRRRRPIREPRRRPPEQRGTDDRPRLPIGRNVVGSVSDQRNRDRDRAFIKSRSRIVDQKTGLSSTPKSAVDELKRRQQRRRRPPTSNDQRRRAMERFRRQMLLQQRRSKSRNVRGLGTLRGLGGSSRLSVDPRGSSTNPIPATRAIRATPATPVTRATASPFAPVIQRPRRRPSGRMVAKGGVITKNRIGANDFREGGFVLSTVDNRKNKK
tara:strand:+ start:414 stop:1106 length:693 start_codon:yes stop_codon:yes gene_type:complete